jgi:DNA-binding HxlR family transcriptional regulator
MGGVKTAASENPTHERAAVPAEHGGRLEPGGSEKLVRAATSTARFGSPVEITAGLLRGRWTALILWNLFWGGKRFYRLLRDLPGIPRKALALELQEMERLGLIERQFHPRDLDGVEYTLSLIGQSLKPVLVTMYEWGLLVWTLPVAGALAVEEQPGTQAEHSRLTEEDPRTGAPPGTAAHSATD